MIHIAIFATNVFSEIVFIQNYTYLSSSKIQFVMVHSILKTTNKIQGEIFQIEYTCVISIINIKYNTCKFYEITELMNKNNDTQIQ